MEQIQITLNDFLRSHEDAVNMKDPSQMLRMVTPDCTRSIGPMSFVRAANQSAGGSSSQPDYMILDNNAFAAHLKAQLGFMTEPKTTLIDSAIDLSKRKASIRFTNAFKAGGQDFVLENVYFIEFTEDGTKIKKIDETIDVLGVQALSNVFAQLQKAV